MGYFDPQWNSLPSIIKIHSLVPTIGILIHTLLMIPIWIETRKHEVQEIVQNPNAEHNHCSQSKSVESFLMNCFNMAVFTVGTINLIALNKQVSRIVRIVIQT